MSLGLLDVIVGVRIRVNIIALIEKCRIAVGAKVGIIIIQTCLCQ